MEKFFWQEVIEVFKLLKVKMGNYPKMRITIFNDKLLISTESENAVVSTWYEYCVENPKKMTLPITFHIQLNIIKDVMSSIEEDTIRLEIIDETHLAFKTSTSRITLNGYSNSDVPKIEKIIGLKKPNVSILLKHYIDQVLFASSTDHSIKSIYGMYLIIKPRKILAFSTDAYVLASYEQFEDVNVDKEIRRFIPYDVAKAIRKYWTMNPTSRNFVYYEKENMTIYSGDVRFDIKATENLDLNVNEVLELKAVAQANINRKQLLNAIRPLLKIDKIIDTVLIELKNEKLTLSAKLPHFEYKNTLNLVHIPNFVNTDKAKVKLSSKLLYKLLKSIKGKEVLFLFREQDKPQLIKVPNNQDLNYIIMPLKMD